MVRDAAALTEGELLAIASKFIEANVNGTVFPLVAYDADALKRDVKLTVGEAVLFVHAMEKLSPSEGDQNEVCILCRSSRECVCHCRSALAWRQN